MLLDPFAGRAFYGHVLTQLLLTQAPVMLDLANLFDHACAKQRVLVDEGDANQVIICQFTAPGDDSRAMRLLAKQGDAQVHGRAETETATGIARNPTEADIVQALLGYAGLFAEHQLHRHLTGMTQKTTHEKPLPRCHQNDIAMISIATEIHLSDLDADRRLLDLPGTSLVIFTSTGCASCRWARRTLPEWSIPVDRLAWIDAGDSAGLVQRYEVFHLPALFVVRDGMFQGALRSRLHAPDLVEALGEALSRPAEELP